MLKIPFSFVPCMAFSYNNAKNAVNRPPKDQNIANKAMNDLDNFCSFIFQTMEKQLTMIIP